MLHDVKANEQLFKRWRNLGTMIAGLASIVRNDMLVDITEVENWELAVQMANQRFLMLAEETLMYISKSKGQIV